MADTALQSGKGGSCPELRIVVIGGRSKNSTGNLILGQNVFDTSNRTAQSTARQREVHGRLVTVVDTPGWLWGYPRENTPELDQIEIQNSVHLCPPGPHAFLLLICVEFSFPSMVQSSLKEHLELFNADVLRHTIVLFTAFSPHKEENIQSFIEDYPSVQQILQLCGNRKHFLHISDSADRTQVLELFRKIEELVTNNLNNPYSVDETQGIILTQELQGFVENASRRRNKVQKKRQKLRALIEGIKNPPDHLKLVIVGPQWSGKSSAGNIIIGKDAFEVNKNWDGPRTAQCEIDHGVFAERRLTIVDSPGWIYNHTLQDTSEMDKLEIENSLYMCPPGPHAVLLVIVLGTAVNSTYQRSVQDHMSLFGDDVWKHTIILFTRGDWLGVKTVEERIESDEGLKWLVNKCENRYHVLNNLEPNNREQVKVLLEKIEEMWAENDDPYYEVDQRRAAEMETLREDADKRAKKMKKIIERQSRVLKEIFKEERQSLSEIRVVLLGQKGSGKSTAGNRILFMEKFQESLDTACIKKDNEDQRVSVKHRGDFDGVKVSVVEAPGWYKDTKAPDWLKHEVHRSVSMCDPGPHAFLLVVPVCKSFTQNDLREFVELLKPFTEKVWAHCMVLFTLGEWLGKHSIEDHIVREGKAIQELLVKCDNRYHVFCLEDSDIPVKDLLQKVIDISTRNRGCFSHEDKQIKPSFLSQQNKQPMVAEEEWKKREQMLIDRMMRVFADEPDETGIQPVKVAQSMDDFVIPDMSGDAMSEYGSISGLRRGHRNVSEWLKQRTRFSDVTSGIYNASSTASCVEEFDEYPTLEQD
ncbi:GTPase IMAP family member 8-like [Oryzias melastigma]|uniref:GTPase IMAP family member 8-like n=1 Tax=Oryzias melastigma TaxID=30732 RepID=UPI00168D1238|nr:GTPase IMAP family member 8-like [Oryzias melastigma]